MIILFGLGTYFIVYLYIIYATYIEHKVLNDNSMYEKYIDNVIKINKLDFVITTNKDKSHGQQ